MYKTLCQNCTLKMFKYLNKVQVCKHTFFKTSLQRLCSTVTNENLQEWNKIKSKYSNKQLTLILKTINKCNVPEMKNKYGIEDQDQIKILESLQSERQQYKSLDDIVSLDVMQVSQLDDICSSIVANKKKVGKKSSIISPGMRKSALENLKSVAGLRIMANHVSWCQVDLTGPNCNILKWDCQSIIDMPFNANHMEIIKMGVSISKAIPDADAFVMEKEASRPMAKINPSIFKLLIRQQQLASVIITMLATRKDTDSSVDNGLNCFHTVKAYAPAQLFGLFVGNETVSSSDIVQALLQEQNVGLKYVQSVSLKDENINYYNLTDMYKKEEMHKSLLLTITFLESILEQG